jgi:hypothetical protein
LRKETFSGVVRLISKVGKTFFLSFFPFFQIEWRKTEEFHHREGERERERKEPMKKDTHITEGTEKVDDHDGFLKDIKRLFFFSSSSSSSHYAHTHNHYL